MKICDEWRYISETWTENFMFPLKVEMDFKFAEMFFKLTFTDTHGNSLETEWMMNVKGRNHANYYEIKNTIYDMEQNINDNLRQSINDDIVKARREAYRRSEIERRVNALF